MVFFCILRAIGLVFQCNLKNFHLLDYENTLSIELEFICDGMVFLNKREQSKRPVSSIKIPVMVVG